MGRTAQKKQNSMPGLQRRFLAPEPRLDWTEDSLGSQSETRTVGVGEGVQSPCKLGGKMAASLATVLSPSAIASAGSAMHAGFLSCPASWPPALNLFGAVHLIGTMAGAASSAFATRHGEPQRPRSSARRISSRRIIPVYAVLQGRRPGIYSVWLNLGLVCTLS